MSNRKAAAEQLAKLEAGCEAQARSAATATDEARGQARFLAPGGSLYRRVSKFDCLQTESLGVASQQREHARLQAIVTHRLIRLDQAQPGAAGLKNCTIVAGDRSALGGVC